MTGSQAMFLVGSLMGGYLLPELVLLNGGGQTRIPLAVNLWCAATCAVLAMAFAYR